MESIKGDSRFSHIASDPRFRPMPKSKKKVKIDSRFQSIFTNKDFSHRTDIDKRGRPLLTGSKKQKHVMERFYDLSESDSDDDSDEQVDVAVKKNKQEKPLNPDKQAKGKRKRKEKEGTTPKTKKLKIDKPHKYSDEDEMDSDEGSEDDPVKTKLQGKSLKENNTGVDDSDDDVDKEEEDEDNSEEEDGDKEEVDDDIVEYTKDHELEETEVDHKWNELHNDATSVSDSTYRLAVCNMDWDFVKAQDLFVLFKSFVPEGGAVRCVTIYPSEFGKERMREEALLGPKEMRKQKQQDEEEGSKGKKQKNCGGDQQKAKRIEKEKARDQGEKLREYQLNRLRYYYAVVECDSIRTADNIYTECDGREYQLSSVRLDLRFIPDDMTFDDEPKERFSGDQGVLDYQPNTFNSTALSQGKVEVTWDETDFDRLSKKMSGLQQKELQSIVEENKYADIIAPPESDSEGEGDGRPEWLRTLLAEGGADEEEEKTITEEEKIRLYRKVLMDKLAEDEEEEKKEEGEFDKELAWTPGLKSAAEKKMRKQEKKKDESAIVGEYLEKKKEKRKKKKEEKMKKRKAENGEAEEEEALAFSDDELPAGFDIEDMKEMLDGEEDLLPSIGKANKKNKSKKVKGNLDDEDLSEADKQAKAELELMMLDNDLKPGKQNEEDDVSGTKKGKKNKKKAKLAKQKKFEDQFELDVEDPRFSALYSSHHFHIDPTAPQFKKTKNMLKLVDEQIKRKNKKGKKQKLNVGGGDKEQTGESAEAPSTKSVSQSLVESLKRKMKK